ncbi:hypothetical protein SAMN05660748_2828 [Blastococcus aggregatus]|uniref:Uncharacterized protein n=1 Tax=Blastococcus aggregatus TaxID=38502 RepID=A0A285V7N9_9ACTN|nr:hypothetical protein [Blastococcus aggregatus]SOC50089.1 hypothetical protein SAMN05660748_2828 [Blastococcus aggregatus]
MFGSRSTHPGVQAAWQYLSASARVAAIYPWNMPGDPVRVQPSRARQPAVKKD